MTRQGAIWALLLLLGVPATAPAGPPFVTNDADPPGLHQFEINLPFTRRRAADGSVGGEVVTLDINYGSDPYTQLSVELPFPYSTTPDGARQVGAGDVLLEYKRRFGLDERRGYFGFNPQLSLPTADASRDLSVGHTVLQIPLIYQKRYGRTLVYHDLRYKWRAGEDGHSYWFLGTALETRVQPRLDLGVELFANTAQADGGSGSSGFNLGGKYELRKGWKLMFSAGRSFEGDPKSTVFLGLKVLLPP